MKTSSTLDSRAGPLGLHSARVAQRRGAGIEVDVIVEIRVEVEGGDSQMSQKKQAKGKKKPAGPVVTGGKKGKAKAKKK